MCGDGLIIFRSPLLDIGPSNCTPPSSILYIHIVHRKYSKYETNISWLFVSRRPNRILKHSSRKRHHGFTEADTSLQMNALYMYQRMWILVIVRISFINTFFIPTHSRKAFLNWLFSLFHVIIAYITCTIQRHSPTFNKSNIATDFFYYTGKFLLIMIFTKFLT